MAEQADGALEAGVEIGHEVVVVAALHVVHVGQSHGGRVVAPLGRGGSQALRSLSE